MSRKDVIIHEGTVSNIRNGIIKVDLIVESSCAACRAKGICGVDSSSRTIEIRTDKLGFDIGEQVNVILKQSLGTKALFLGYILPFILVVLSLISMLNFGVSEGISGLVSIAILLPYYLFLYLFRNKIKKEFNFDIDKILN